MIGLHLSPPGPWRSRRRVHVREHWWKMLRADYCALRAAGVHPYLARGVIIRSVTAGQTAETRG